MIFAKFGITAAKMRYSEKKAVLPTNRQSLIAGRIRQSGFTLIEVMLAVAILSLVATAALKLTVMAQDSLRAARDNNNFITEAQKLRAKIVTGELPQSGNDKNLSWKSEIKTKEFFGKDFGKLNFDKKDDENKIDTQFQWRELEISDNTKKKKIKIVLPLAQGE